MKKLFILLLFFSLFFYSKQVSAQQCINGGVTCCVEGTGPNGYRDPCAYSYPGSCDSSCSPTCDGPGSSCYIDDTTPGGGGGGYQYPTCGGSQVLKCGSDPNVYLIGVGGETNNSDLAQCEFRPTCGDDYFPSIFSVTGCDGKPDKGVCQINCDCCNAGDDYVKSTTTGSNYTREINCNSSIPSLYCNEWDDIFVSRSRGTGAGICYKGCDGEEDPETGKCDGTKYTVYNDIVTCTSVTTSWSCVPTCTSTAPSTPTLLSPANSSTVSTANISLVWNNLSQTWGAGCPTNTNQFEVYIGTSPTSLALMGTVASGTGSTAFSGTADTTYYWKVRAKNGSANTDSAVWSFTINEGPWWQVKDGDVTTNGVRGFESATAFSI